MDTGEHTHAVEIHAGPLAVVIEAVSGGLGAFIDVSQPEQGGHHDGVGVVEMWMDYARTCIDDAGTFDHFYEAVELVDRVAADPPTLNGYRNWLKTYRAVARQQEQKDYCQMVLASQLLEQLLAAGGEPALAAWLKLTTADRDTRSQDHVDLAEAVLGSCP